MKRFVLLSFSVVEQCGRLLAHQVLQKPAKRSLQMAPSAGKEVGSSKKKSRRGSRQGEYLPSSYHFGPVACTTAALVQAYLTIDPHPTPNAAPSARAAAPKANGESGKDGKSKTSNDTPKIAGGSLSLNMSESRFDVVKRRFGGKSKLVSLLPSLVGGGSGNKGKRLSFGPGTKVVATKEAVHTTLHCRCVVVLLCEASTEEGTNANGPSSSRRSRAAASESSIPGNGKRIDKAHLVTLSPDDLFLALSVDTFPLSVDSSPSAAPVGMETGSQGATASGGVGGSGGNGSGSSHTKSEISSSLQAALPRAFEVMDGPIVAHRPASRPGKPWPGLEIYRPNDSLIHDNGDGQSWIGQRIPIPMGVGQALRGTEIRGRGQGDYDNDGGSSSLESEARGSGSTPSFRLDLAAAAAETNRFGGEDTRQPIKRFTTVGGGMDGTLLVCPPRRSLSVGAESVFSGQGRGTGLGQWGAHDEADAAVVALPVGGVGAVRPTPSWMSLSIGSEGPVSLSPWRGPPSGLGNSLTCLCRAPDMDSGLVGLVGALPGAGIKGGLMLRPLPPTLYIGVADGQDDGTRRQVGGLLLELQGGITLSCSRSLPAPPLAITPAAVDDAHGVLVALLADAAGTALLLARDGSDFPVVEEYRGVAATFTGDFLGNGREQVVLLPIVSSTPGGSTSSASGGGATGGDRRATVAAKSCSGGWEQLPLKAIVKRALVTDCSCIWGNGRRDDLAALPGAGPIQVVGVRPSGSGTGDDGGATVTSGVSSLGLADGRKRPRAGGEDTNEAKRGRATVSTAVGPPAGSVATKKDEEVDDHRLHRLSTVVGVLRRRVQAEEARLLRLRQARRGKAAVLEAATLALTLRVGGRGIVGGASGNGDQSSSAQLRSIARKFYDGQNVPSDASISSPRWVDENMEETRSFPMECKIARVRLHAPSRTLCLDADVSYPSQMKDEVPEASTVAAINVCLSVGSSSGRLTTRSAVCPRLLPGQSATVRSCVDVPLDLLAGSSSSAVRSNMKMGDAASLYVSFAWSSSKDVAVEGGTREATGGGEGDDHHSRVFARILISPQDMLGIGTLSSEAGTLPAPTTEENSEAPFPARSAIADGRRKGGVKTTSPCSSAKEYKHLGLFDVGTRLDLLVRSDTPSLAALPQAVRSLSAVASLPEPWAGGASATVSGCAERAAECTLHAGGSAGALSVLLKVTAGALPDRAQASADYGSERGRGLIVAAASALQDEMAALEVVARERHKISSNSGGGVKMTVLSASLERYRVAQMRSDVLASQVAGRVSAARGEGGEGRARTNAPGSRWPS